MKRYLNPTNSFFRHMGFSVLWLDQRVEPALRVNPHEDKPYRDEQVSGWKLFFKQRLLNLPAVHLVLSWKAIVDTLKPYKSDWHKKRDLLQPIDGIRNITRGVILLAIVPVYTTLKILRYFLLIVWRILRDGPNAQNNLAYIPMLGQHRSEHVFKFFIRESTSIILFSITCMLDASLGIARGVLQIAFTPVNYLLRMPFRLALTAIFGMKTLEDSSGLKKLVEETERELGKTTPSQDTIYDNYHLIHSKYIKSYNRGQTRSVTKEVEQSVFNSNNLCDYRGYGDKVHVNRDDQKRAGLHYCWIFSNDKETQRSWIEQEPIKTTRLSDQDYFANHERIATLTKPARQPWEPR